MGAAYRARSHDIRDVVEACLTEVHEGTVFERVTADRAAARAALLAAELEGGTDRGVLHGVPIAVKDVIDMVGYVTAAGSNVLARVAAPAKRDATVVQRLERAGAVIVGKTTLTELAYSSLGLATRSGVAPNAYRPDRVAGGSSSGSAIAVAKGLVVAAVGTDTGGSIRVPAAFNGLVGMKPSNGTVPTDGIVHHSFTLDTVGPIARTVTDAWHLWRAMLDLADRAQPPTCALAGLRLVVPEAPYLEDLADDVRVAFEWACGVLRGAGAVVQARDVAALRAVPRLYDRHGSFSSTELAMLHGAWIERHADEVDPHLLRRAREDRDRSAVDHARLHWERIELQRRFATESVGIDAYLMPTTPITAPPIDTVREPAGFKAVNAVVPRNTKAWNLLGGPAITLPCGVDAEGLPIGIMVAGLHGTDEALFGIASAAEQALTAHGVWPVDLGGAPPLS